MQEKIIEFDATNPTEIFGVNNSNINVLRNHFPKLKLVVRGAEIKAIGTSADIEKFEIKIESLVNHYQKFNQLTEVDVGNILVSDEKSDKDSKLDVIVHSVNGGKIKARTKNQQKMVEDIAKNDLLFAVGPAGSGKTYTAVALAVQALKDKAVKKIILTRPAVEAGENLGFLPGDLKEKLDPYLQPLYDALRDMIPAEKLAYYIENGVIQIAPIAFMRGRTLDKAFVILDEAQNATNNQMKMFLTRMGKSAKFIITGDLTQVDLPYKQQSGLEKAVNILDGVKGISIIRLNEKDVIRHRLVRSIINKYDKEENGESN